MYYYSDSDDYSNYNDNDEDSSSFEDCQFCDATYKIRNRQRHMENVHKCPYCPNYMPKESIQAHIDRKHMKECLYCNKCLLPEQLQQHELTCFFSADHLIEKLELGADLS